MASYPPPYPAPKPGSPFNLDPKQQRRFAREQFRMQERAQKAAFKAQRNAYRYQIRGLRRSSILGPLIIVIAGVVILLVKLGKIPLDSSIVWFGHWWPLVLVVAGLVLVAEWAFDQMPKAEGVPQFRRGVGGSAVFLLFVVAALGVSASGFRDGRDFMSHGLTRDWSNFEEMFGDRHESSQALDAPFPVGTALAINNPHGDVTVTGHTGDDKIHITVDKQVYSRSDSDADAKAHGLDPRIENSGSSLTVTVPTLDGATANLTISMPDYGPTTINANHGNVTVLSMRAGLTVNANHGDVDLNLISGAVAANVNSNNSSFTAHNLTGDLLVRGHADDLNVTQVDGRVSFEGEFYGDTHLEHVKGPVNFRTSRTQFSLARLDGEVDISPKSELSASRIVGPIELTTRSRNITLDQVAGDVTVKNSKGSVDVTSASPLGNVTIENRDGAVNLTVPDHAGLTVDAQTTGGEVDNDLNLVQSSSNDHATLHGTIGNGASRVSIRTTHFGIDIHKDNSVPSTSPQPPAPPAPPTIPASLAAPAATSHPAHRSAAQKTGN